MFRYGRILECSQHCIEKCGYSISLSITSWFLFFPCFFSSSTYTRLIMIYKPPAWRGSQAPLLTKAWKSLSSFPICPFENRIFFSWCFVLAFFIMLPKKLISILCFWLFIEKCPFHKFLETSTSQNSVANNVTFHERCGLWDISSHLGLDLTWKTWINNISELILARPSGYENFNSSSNVFYRKWQMIIF